MNNLNKFSELGVPEALCAALNAMNINIPTDIQKYSIPKIIENNDIYGCAQTGSGKTYAYLLPLMGRRIDSSIKGAQILIITPTHELASQVARVSKQLAQSANMPYKTALLIGGASISRQLEAIKEKPEIVVGSTGRILELIKLRKLRVHNVKTIVIDEADRMLDKINIDDVKAIIKCTLKERQLLFFSATCSTAALEAAKALGVDLELITPPDSTVVPNSIRHIYLDAGQKRDKIILLRKLLAATAVKRAIVFLEDIGEIQEITGRLNYHNISTVQIYGEDKKNNRRLAFERIRDNSAQVLVASDLGARGLDIPDVGLVVSMDAPEDAARYLHRAGRTGRNGASGISALILLPGEQQYIAQYEKKLGITVAPAQLLGGCLKEK